MPQDVDDDRVQYTYTPKRDRWDDWKDTVPRSIPLDSRLDSLIAADAAGVIDVPEGEDADEYLGDDARRAVIQIRRHAMRASQQLGDDEDTCRKEIRTIKRVADDVL